MCDVMWCHIYIVSHCTHLECVPPHTTRGQVRLAWLQHTATHCNTLQHTATHCNTLQHTATHCDTLPHTATHCNTLHHICNTLQHANTATYCNTLHHTATRCSTLQHTATLQNTLQPYKTRSNTLQHSATHCNTLQRTVTHCNTLRHTPRRKRGAGAHLQLQQCTQEQLQQHPSLPVPTCLSVDIWYLVLGFRIWMWNR